VQLDRRSASILTVTLAEWVCTAISGATVIALAGIIYYKRLEKGGIRHDISRFWSISEQGQFYEATDPAVIITTTFSIKNVEDLLAELSRKQRSAKIVTISSLDDKKGLSIEVLQDERRILSSLISLQDDSNRLFALFSDLVQPFAAVKTVDNHLWVCYEADVSILNPEDLLCLVMNFSIRFSNFNEGDPARFTIDRCVER
jgi:hypothetical protein